MKMTGKDLVLFIINHDLLNTEINWKVKDLFLTVEEAAVKLGISTTSLLDMLKLEMFDYVVFNDTIYVSKDIELSKIKKRR